MHRFYIYIYIYIYPIKNHYFWPFHFVCLLFVCLSLEGVVLINRTKVACAIPLQTCCTIVVRSPLDCTELEPCKIQVKNKINEKWFGSDRELRVRVVN